MSIITLTKNHYYGYYVKGVSESKSTNLFQLKHEPLDWNLSKNHNKAQQEFSHYIHSCQEKLRNLLKVLLQSLPGNPPKSNYQLQLEQYSCKTTNKSSFTIQIRIIVVRGKFQKIENTLFPINKFKIFFIEGTNNNKKQPFE